ncbi:MAG TPA: Rab family GTPase [Vicinamibacterales bacterium]|nr:Rab family GTPase [Vicinamibacterales bacterium]
MSEHFGTIQKKICMLGSFAVGKTSLVSRYVRSIFSDKYLSTVGVKVDKKMINVDGQEVMLMLWDVNGQDDFQPVQATHLRGMSGYLLVVDGTRRATFDTAEQLYQKAMQTVGDVPFILLLNKSDLASEWEIDDQAVFRLTEQGWRVVRTSAKTGDGVEGAFDALARAMLAEAPADEEGTL